MNRILLFAFAFAGTFSIGQQRVTLIETFTSSTCAPCNPGNVTLQNLLADTQNDGKNVSIKYQMYWPGTGDPYYFDEGEMRRTVYSVSSIPNTRIDGTSDYNTGSLTQSNLNSAYAVAPKAGIIASYTINETTQTVDVDVEVEAFVNTPPGVRLYIAIFEFITYNNAKSNGETSFYHVVKKMIPGGSGIVLSPLTAGQTYHYTGSYTFNGSYVLPPNATAPADNSVENTVEEFSDLGVAVWLQTLSTREVYQAGYAALSSAGVEEETNEIATAKIYPNPAGDNADVAVQLTSSQSVKMEVIDMTGKVIISNDLGTVEAGRTVHNLDTSDLPNGMYTVRISSEESVLSKRLVIQD